MTSDALPPLSLSRVRVHVMYMCIWMCVYMCVETRGHYWMSSITVHLQCVCVSVDGVCVPVKCTEARGGQSVICSGTLHLIPMR